MTSPHFAGGFGNSALAQPLTARKTLGRMRATFFCLILVVSRLGCLAAETDAPASAATVTETKTLDSVGIRVVQTAEIQLGAVGPISAVGFPPTPPTTVVTGTRVRLTATAAGPAATVEWFKNDTLIARSGSTHEIAQAEAADSGWYYARFLLPDGRLEMTDTLALFVTTPGQRLANTAARVRVAPGQPPPVVGFVVEPGPKATQLLVRAVGPSLSRFGVTDPLADPSLVIWNSRGQSMTPVTRRPASPATVSSDGISVVATDTPSVAAAEIRVGAFPLPENAIDPAHVYRLAPGAYTVQVGSASGAGTGTVLLEIYDVPL